MARNILLRFEPKDELIVLIDKVAKKLGVTGSGLAKIALYDYCNKILNMGEKK
jgi:hypothetical protein